jgi:hypothetical protein
VHEPTAEEQHKYDKEYEEFMKQLEAEKEKFDTFFLSSSSSLIRIFIEFAFSKNSRYRKDHPESQDQIPDEKKIVSQVFFFLNCFKLCVEF